MFSNIIKCNTDFFFEFMYCGIKNYIPPPKSNHIIQENKKEKDTTLCFLSQNLRILVQTLNNKKTKTQKQYKESDWIMLIVRFYIYSFR